MKAICLLFLFTFTQSSFAQWPEFNRAHPVSCQWPAFNYNAHGYFENVFVIDTIPSFYNGFVVFGNGLLCHPDSCINDTRAFSAKCNANGDLMWWNRYDNVGVDENQQWFNWFNGNLGGMMMNRNQQIVSIYTTFVDGDQNNIDTRNYLVYLDAQGQILNRYLVDSTLAQYSTNGLIEDLSDSTYVLHGWYRDSLDVINNIPPNAFLLKLDSLGNHVWQNEYPNTFGTWTVSKALDHGFWICAEQGNNACSDGFFANTDLVLIKTDEFGNEEDRMVMGGQCGNERATVYEYEEDKIILVGRITSFDNGPSIGIYDGYLYTALLEQFPNGQLSDTTEFKKYLHSYDGDFVDLHLLNDGSFLLVSDMVYDFFNSSPELIGRTMGSILKLNNNRDSLWSKAYSYYNNFPAEFYPYAEHYVLDSKLTPDGGIVCSGWIQQQPQDPNPFLQTPWLFKVDSLGCLEPGCQDVGVSEIVIGLQNTMSLYPNPVSSTANISFSFPSDYAPPKQSELVVIDMQGKEVLRQKVTMFGQSNSTIELSVSNLSSGIYTVHWVSENTWLDSIKLIKD